MVGKVPHKSARASAYRIERKELDKADERLGRLRKAIERARNRATPETAQVMNEQEWLHAVSSTPKPRGSTPKIQGRLSSVKSALRKAVKPGLIVAGVGGALYGGDKLLQHLALKHEGKQKTAGAGKLLPPHLIKGLPGLLTYEKMTGPYAREGRERHRRVMQAFHEGWPAGMATE